MATFPTVTTGDLVSAADWNSLQPHVYDAVDFDVAATNLNTSLTTSFQTVLTKTYTPPADWTTYTLKAVGEAHITGLNTAGPHIAEVSVRIDGVAGTVLNLPADASTVGGVSPGKVSTGLSGAQTVDLRIRNATASSGEVETATLDLAAKRET